MITRDFSQILSITVICTHLCSGYNKCRIHYVIENHSRLSIGFYSGKLLKPPQMLY